MHPAINREVSESRIADFHNRARLATTAREAARALRANKATAHADGAPRFAARLARHVLAFIATANRALPSTAAPRHGGEHLAEPDGSG